LIVAALRFFLLALVLLIVAPASAAEEAALSADRYSQRLDRARGTIDEVTKALAQPGLNDRTLRLLRGRIEPLPAELSEIVAALEPRIQAIAARLAELAPPETKPAPVEPAPAPPPAVKTPEAAAKKTLPGKEPPAAPKTEPELEDSAAAAGVAAEIAEQSRLRDELDAVVKRARALALEARQTLEGLVARQREFFANTLLLRSNSLFSPALWRDAVADAPRALAAANGFLADRAANFARRLSGGSIEFFAALAVAVALFPATLLLGRRLQARRGAAPPATRLRRVWGAAATALLLAAAPLAVLFALSVALEEFDLLEASVQPLAWSFAAGVLRVVVALALARAIFAPPHPHWRLIDPGDPAASRLVVLIVAIAGVISLEKIAEQLEDAANASLSLVVATRGFGVLLVAALIALALATTRRRAAEERGDGAGPDWPALARFFGALVVAALVAALAAGYVALADFAILHIGWIALAFAALYLAQALTDAAIATALDPAGRIGFVVSHSLGAPRESLRPVAVLLAGVVTLTCYALAVLAALAPIGVGAGAPLVHLESAFFEFRIGDVSVSLATLLSALLLFAVTLGAAHALRRWLDTRFLPLTHLDMGLRNSIGTSFGYLGFLFAAGVALSHLGLSFERVALIAGALSLGIGMGLQSIASNFASGIILLWERAIRVGDWVVVGDEQGYVKRINVRSTEIETFDRATMIVPNSNLVSGVVKNWLRGDRVGRIKIALQPHSGVDPEQMRDIMLAAARAQEGVLRIPAPQVMFLAFEATSYRFELWCYVEDVEQSTRVRSDLHFDLHKRLAAAGVALAAEPPKPATTVVQLPGLDKLAAAVAGNAQAVEEAAQAQQAARALTATGSD
jgi:potassium-dependent mechanosensitive channel